MTDHHVHIGQYNKIYFYPDRVVKALSENGIEECFVSSTTSCIFCRELHLEFVQNATARQIMDAVEKELECAVQTGLQVGVKVKPLHWVVPDFEKCSVHFEECFSSATGFSYAGFKIHPLAQNWDFSNAEIVSLAERVFAFADKNSLLVLIHTGIDECASPLKFEGFVKCYPNVKVQLAHCKNMQAINYMLETYKNVFADNSTTPEVLAKGKILFGSDFPALHKFSTDPETSELSLLYRRTKT